MAKLFYGYIVLLLHCYIAKLFYSRLIRQAGGRAGLNGYMAEWLK
jgi:hypothetical protein